MHAHIEACIHACRRADMQACRDGFPRGVIHEKWRDAEKIRVAPRARITGTNRDV